MAAKCALVVDDSKSARAFLSRILEKHLLDVDCVESAEEALDYLTRHRPDVIFMDHLMPGMDGFQAVQAIKNNPRTATIPILMYTSQEGELYLGQARALGALGVLPKQIRPADVTQVLLQLHLFDERRERPVAVNEAGPNDPTQVSPALLGATATTPVLPPELQVAALAGAPVGAMAAAVADAPVAAATGSTGRYAFGSPVDQLLRDQIAEVRRSVVARIDELQGDLPTRLHEAVRAQLPPPAPPAPVVEVRSMPDRRGWLTAAALGAIALLFAGLWAREQGQRLAIERSLVALLENEHGVHQAPASAAPEPAAETAAGASAVGAARAAAAAETRPRGANAPVIIVVPFGEQPLAGERVGAVRGVLDELRRGDFHGDVDVQVYQGRFCLIGNAGEGYSLPPEDLLYARCERIGNLSQDGGASRESLPFANMLAEQRKAAGATLNIRITEGGAERFAQAYPEVSSMTTAGQWNSSAAANNRIEVRWRERP